MLVNADYDYEQMTSFKFTVRATDLNTTRYFEQNFTVLVLNVEEPVITMNISSGFQCPGSFSFILRSIALSQLSI